MGFRPAGLQLSPVHEDVGLQESDEMKVFQIQFDVTDSKTREITRETVYWTAPSLFAATAAASTHAYEYEKHLVAVADVLVVTRQVDFKEGQKELEACLDDGMLYGEGGEL